MKAADPDAVAAAPAVAAAAAPAVAAAAAAAARRSAASKPRGLLARWRQRCGGVSGRGRWSP